MYRLVKKESKFMSLMNGLEETIKLTSNVSANYLILMKLLWGFKQIDEKYMTLIHSYLRDVQFTMIKSYWLCSYLHKKSKVMQNGNLLYICMWLTEAFLDTQQSNMCFQIHYINKAALCSCEQLRLHIPKCQY